jgi:hypothetical protein
MEGIRMLADVVKVGFPLVTILGLIAFVLMDWASPYVREFIARRKAERQEKPTDDVPEEEAH